jgi:hypothetical protein
MSRLQTSIVLFAAVALAQPSALADDKPVPKPDGADARLEWIADQVAAHEVLRGVFGKQVKASALDWLARANYPARVQFALSIRMATDFPNQPRDEAHAKLVTTTLQIAKAKSEQQTRIKDLLVKNDEWLVSALKERATDLSNERNTKNLMTLEIAYNETIAATEKADLTKYVNQTPNEFLAVRQQLRDAFLATLRKKPELEKLFPAQAEPAAELVKSRKRIGDFFETPEKKSGTPDKKIRDEEDPEVRLIRAEIGLLAARFNRASRLLEAEMNGKDERSELEKASEKLLITRYNLSDAKADVATKAREIRFAAEAVEKRNKDGKALSEIEKVRNEKLAACKEVANYKAASERLLGLVKEREKALREASDAGRDIRTEFEKAADKFNKAVADSPEYPEAVKRLKAARQNKVVTDLALTESTSAPLRAALLRVELAGKK